MAGGALRHAAFAAVAVVAASGEAGAQSGQASAASAGAADAASNITVLRPAFFAEFRPNTALDMIGRIPGFSFDDGGGGRGFAGNAGNVLIDGERPPSRGDSLGSVLSRIPASAVERIEVIRGGAPGVDMQGLSILANVIRRKDAGLTGAISGSVGVNSQGDVSPGLGLQVQNQVGGQTLEGALNAFRSTNSQRDRRTQISPAGALLLQSESSGANAFSNVELKGSWETGLAGGRLRVNGLAKREGSESSSIDRLLVPGGAESSASDDATTSGEAGLRFARTIAGFGAELVGYQSLRRNESTDRYDTPSFTSGGVSETRSGESIVRASIRPPKAADVSFDLGAEAVYNFRESDTATTFQGSSFRLSGDTSEVSELRSEAFGSATWAPSSQLNIEAGLRYEWSTIRADVSDRTSEKSLRYLKPRASLSWAPTPGRQLLLRAERSVDQLSFGAFQSSASFQTDVFGVGNPDIEPAKSWRYQARYERQFGGQTSFVANYLHTELQDVINRTVIYAAAPGTDPASCIAPSANCTLLEISRNTGGASRDFLELTGTAELDRLGFAGGLLRLGGEFETSNTIDPVTGERRELSGVNAWTWNASLTQSLDGGRLRWSMGASDAADQTFYSVRTVNVGGFDAPGLFANVTWRPTPEWTLGASLNNVAARERQNELTLHVAPRPSPVRYVERRSSATWTQASINARRSF